MPYPFRRWFRFAQSAARWSPPFVALALLACGSKAPAISSAAGGAGGTVSGTSGAGGSSAALAGAGSDNGGASGDTSHGGNSGSAGLTSGGASGNANGGSAGTDAGGSGGAGPTSIDVTLSNWTKSGWQVVTQDIAGNNVDAHDGDLHSFNGTFYLYGTSYDCGWAWNGGSTWCGVNVYTSSDLRHWSHGKAAFPLTPKWTSAARCGGPNGCFRPHVVHNPNSGLYVMWLNRGPAGGDDTNASYYTLTSQSPDGPFVETPSTPTLCKHTGNGDVSLFVDGTTGYAVYTAFGDASTSCAAAQRAGSSNRIGVEKLDSTFTTSVDASHASCPADPCASNSTFAWLSPQSNYENGYVFRRGDAYYVVYQDTCPYCNEQLTDPTDGQENVFYRTAQGSPFNLASASPHDISAAPRAGRPASDHACQGQISFIADVPNGSGDHAFVYVSDLWDDAVAGTKGSQAQANFMWEKLTFGADGSIAPLTCPNQTSVSVPAPTAPPPALASVSSWGTPYNDFCDIRGAVERAEVFEIPTTGTLTDVSTVVYRSNGRSNPPSFVQEDGNADGHLLVELFATSGGLPTGAALASLSLPAETVLFGRRRVSLHPNRSVMKGESYALVLSSQDTTTGAYGFLYSDDKPLGSKGAELYQSTGTWGVEANRDLYLDATIE